MKFYEYECKDCDNGNLIVSLILKYPCLNCFDGKRTWIDDIIPPSKAKYQTMKRQSIERNIHTLTHALTEEYMKVGYTIDIQVKPITKYKSDNMMYYNTSLENMYTREIIK